VKKGVFWSHADFEIGAEHQDLDLGFFRYVQATGLKSLGFKMCAEVI
jgi:hypothetical protein